jgi:hypothetical protein
MWSADTYRRRGSTLYYCILKMPANTETSSLFHRGFHRQLNLRKRRHSPRSRYLTFFVKCEVSPETSRNVGVQLSFDLLPIWKQNNKQVKQD